MVTIWGRINVHTASSLGEAIQSLVVDGASNVIVDLSSVDFVDSSGLGTLVGNSKSITSSGGVLCLVGITERLRRILENTNLAGYFRIHDSVDEALDGLEISTANRAPSSVGGS